MNNKELSVSKKLKFNWKKWKKILKIDLKKQNRNWFEREKQLKKLSFKNYFAPCCR